MTELCYDKKKGQDRIRTEQEEKFQKLKEERIGQNWDIRANQI